MVHSSVEWMAGQSQHTERLEQQQSVFFISQAEINSSITCQISTFVIHLNTAQGGNRYSVQDYGVQVDEHFARPWPFQDRHKCQERLVLI